MHAHSIMGNRAVQRAFKFSSGCCLLLLMLSGVSTLYAESSEKQKKNEVIAIGASAIVRGNLALAKRAAISQSLKKGVENYLLRRLGQQGVVNNFQRPVSYTHLTLPTN